MSKSWFAGRWVVIGLLSTLSAFGQDPAVDGSLDLVSVVPPSGALGESLRRETAAAVSRGLDWLVANQKEDGSWSDGNFPALTALPLWALVRGGQAEHARAVSNAVSYILSCVQPDGGIYRGVPGQKGGGLSNYNTAICMTALYATGDKSLIPVVLKAREFVAATQHMGDDIYQGGFGYDTRTGRPYTDLLNTFYSVEAMALTAGAEELRPSDEKRTDIDWKATVRFLERMQNLDGAPAADRGGFFYNPSDPKAGTSTNAQGVVTFRSYGSITYAGMLALVYANVSRSDPRVVSALDWAARHWTLDENPGMGTEGLFFFYNVLTRSLAACGRDLVPRPDGSVVDWRREVAQALVAKQKIVPETGTGYWVNDSGRYWESNPVLVTAYALLSLDLR